MHQMGREHRNGACSPVLIVDDDVDICNSVSDALEHEGYPVEIRHDGVQALAYLRDGARPRLILLDILMPVMDGRAFRKVQREDPALSSIPVIPFSAHLEPGDAEAMATPYFIRKPIRLETLLATVRQFSAPPTGGEMAMYVRTDVYRTPFLILLAAIVGWILLQAAIAQRDRGSRDERRPFGVRSEPGRYGVAGAGPGGDGQRPMGRVSLGASRIGSDWGAGLVSVVP